LLGPCLAIVVAVVLSPASSDELHEPQWEVLEQRPGQGEQCLVCRKQIYDEDVVEIRFKGRTFHVGLRFLGDFEDDPQRYFASLQARSALFDENAVGGGRSMAFGWLWLGVYVLGGLVCSALCGYIAVCKALSPLPWFFAGLAGNLAGLGLVMFVPRGDITALPAGIPPGLCKVPTTRAPVACPSCGIANHPSAQRCPGCGHALTPTVESEARRASE